MTLDEFFEGFETSRSPGRFMHHLELQEPREVDEELRSLLREAWESAGEGS